MTDAKTVVVAGGFDDFKSQHVRLLEEASKLGGVRVLLWSDETVRALEGHPPKFPQEERLYLLQADRYVKGVRLVTGQTPYHRWAESILKYGLWRRRATIPGSGPTPNHTVLNIVFSRRKTWEASRRRRSMLMVSGRHRSA